MHSEVAIDDAMCEELANMACVFIVALGRTGSTHLLRVLNAIPGYRLSGETDNAWIYMGWFARSRARLGDEDTFDDIMNMTRRLAPRRYSHSAAEEMERRRTICGARQMMMLLHNPVPRARVFGFKEIYSPFVRQPNLTNEIFRQGVHFLRVLFPRAKFIFHYRRNFTRVANSDFWHRDAAADANADGKLVTPTEHGINVAATASTPASTPAIFTSTDPSATSTATSAGSNDKGASQSKSADAATFTTISASQAHPTASQASGSSSIARSAPIPTSPGATSGAHTTHPPHNGSSPIAAHFASLAQRFEAYPRMHADHAFVTTIDELIDRSDTTQLQRLFAFLGEPLTPKLRKLAASRSALRDWTEEKHRRRIKRFDANGSVLVETKDYAYYVPPPSRHGRV